jgi:hypothetical protein
MGCSYYTGHQLIIMDTSKELEKFIKKSLKQLRRTKDPSSFKTMLKRMNEVVQEMNSGKRRPNNATKIFDVLTVLFSKELGSEQTEV